MNILYVAYSCVPNKGSEEKIGWSIPLESSKTNKVFVVTKEEHRKTIEQYIQEHSINNIKFYYVDIPKVYKKVFKGIAYSMRLNIWLKKSLEIVKKICENEKIDIVHQITPVEFRSIGDYYKIPNIKFICGPLGGGEFIPKGLRCYAKGNLNIEILRFLLNIRAKIKYGINKKFQHCDYIFFANNNTKQYLASLISKTNNSVVSDTGISEADIEEQNKNLVVFNDTTKFIVVGRLAYRKGHELLFDALSQLPDDINYHCRIVGSGPDDCKLKQLVEKKELSNNVEFVGRIPFENIAEEYRNADVFIMPSIRETTGSVLLEAMSKGLPIITFDQFGGKVLLDDESAWLVKGSTKEEYIEAIKNALISCCEKPAERVKKGEKALQKAKQHTWQNKMAVYNTIYKELNG